MKFIHIVQIHSMNISSVSLTVRYGGVHISLIAVVGRPSASERVGESRYFPARPRPYGKARGEKFIVCPADTAATGHQMHLCPKKNSCANSSTKFPHIKMVLYRVPGRPPPLVLVQFLLITFHIHSKYYIFMVCEFNEFREKIVI